MRYADPDYGFSIDLPGDWDVAMCGPRFVGLRSRDLDAGYYLQLMESKPMESMLNVIGGIAFYTIFAREAKSIRIISFSEEKNSFNVEISDGENEYIWYGLSMTLPSQSHGRTIHIITSIFYNKAYIGSKKEKEIAGLIVSIITGLNIGKDSFGLLHGSAHYFYDDQILGERKWECSVPNNYRLAEIDRYGFVAYTNRVYIRIKAHYYPYSTPGFLKEYANQKLSEAYYLILNQDKYIVVKEDMGAQSYYAYTTSGNQYWRALGHWTIQRYYDLVAKREFLMVLEKLTIYPARIERDFLPIVYGVFASFITGPAWLSEDTGLQMEYARMKAASIPSISPPPMRKDEPQQRKTVSTTKRGESEFIRRWREKLKRDLKRLYDWEERMWSDVYDTLKWSDVMTGMYTLEDKHGKTRLIDTENLATPSTHTFWKPKSDPTWSTGAVLATRKPFRPKYIHQWEKLSWHWDKEKERLRKDVERKKKEIDMLF